jgi:hypothetical protein
MAPTTKRRGPTEELDGAPIPPDNEPGHHPEHEQDRPDGPGPWGPPAGPERFPFRFTSATLLLGAPFGVTPWTTYLDITDGDLFIRYGPWSLRTPLENVVGTTPTGPYHLAKIAGPPRLSLADRGVSFATDTEAGLCIRFRDGVRTLDPTGLLRHPAATVTVVDLEGLARRLD